MVAVSFGVAVTTTRLQILLVDIASSGAGTKLVVLRTLPPSG
jgi:hypothetical protein